MGFKIQGVSAVDAEIEQNTRALRVVQRPDDWGSLGIYSIAQVSGTMTAALGANSNIWTFRNSTTNVYLIRQVRIGAGFTNTAPGAANVVQFSLFFIRGNTANATGGTSATTTGSFQKRRTSMATTGVANVQIANTGAITLGTGTVDSIAMGSACYPHVITTAGQIIMPNTYLWDVRDTEYPIVLAQSEGLTIQLGANAMVGTATWQFGVTCDWLELASF